jgi:hypothetical protein
MAVTSIQDPSQLEVTSWKRVVAVSLELDKPICLTISWKTHLGSEMLSFTDNVGKTMSSNCENSFVP